MASDRSLTALAIVATVIIVVILALAGCAPRPDDAYWRDLAGAVGKQVELKP